MVPSSSFSCSPNQDPEDCPPGFKSGNTHRSANSFLSTCGQATARCPRCPWGWGTAQWARVRQPSPPPAYSRDQSSSSTSLSISSRRDSPSSLPKSRGPPCPSPDPTTDSGKTWDCNPGIRGPGRVSPNRSGSFEGRGRREPSKLGWAGEEGLVT